MKHGRHEGRGQQGSEGTRGPPSKAEAETSLPSIREKGREKKPQAPAPKNCAWSEQPPAPRAGSLLRCLISTWPGGRVWLCRQRPPDTLARGRRSRAVVSGVPGCAPQRCVRSASQRCSRTLGVRDCAREASEASQDGAAALNCCSTEYPEVAVEPREVFDLLVN
eukprot:1838750-Heterocapsa_arctica.AAC.1